MGRSPGRLLVVALCAAHAVLFTTVGTPAESNKDAGQLDGSWKLISVEQDGEKMERDDDVRWVFKDGWVFYADEPLATVVIYAASTPVGLDLLFREPKNTYEGIYALEKDELRICLNTSTTGPKDRPSDFATREKPNLRVLKFERIDPSAAGPGTSRGYVGMALAVQDEKVVIQDVLENSPAQKAGLRAGDVILTLGGQIPGDLRSTVQSVRRQGPGSELAIRVLRDGKQQDLTLRVAVFPFALLGILG
jgi:uncharacterized protein (TIGR03067 family)